MFEFLEHFPHASSDIYCVSSDLKVHIDFQESHNEKLISDPNNFFKECKHALYDKIEKCLYP